MKDVILLTKTLFKSSGNEGNKIRKNANKKSRISGFMLFAYVYIVGVVAFVSYNLIKSLIVVHQPAIFINMAFMLMLGICTIQSIISCLNVLFFSKDLETLLPLPIKSIKIVMAKINCVILSDYIMELLIILPGMILYGYLLNLGITYYIIALLAMLVFPVIPIAIIALLVTLVTKFTKIIKSKEALQYLSVILTLVLIIAVQFLAVGGNEEITNEELGNMLIKTNGILELYSGMFPTIELVINSILNYNNIKGLINIITLAAISILTYYISSFVISKVYVKTVMNLNSIKSKKIKKVDFKKEVTQEKIYKSYLKKEFKLLNRNPIFFMQCVLPSILFPFIIAIPVIITFQNENVELLKYDLGNIINSGIGIFGCLIVAIFFFMMNFASVTAVSRDGENAVFMKYLPLSLKKQIWYKALPGMVLNLLPITYEIIFIVFFIPQIHIRTLIYFIIISNLINVLNNILMILVDLKNPKLKWITEYTVVKQNMNMVYEFALIILEGVLIYFASINFITLDGLGIFLTVIFIILNIAIFKYISKNEQKLFNKII